MNQFIKYQKYIRIIYLEKLQLFQNPFFSFYKFFN